ncbi:hypothetical protein DLAC_06052 [Tieghemostelium lacteum]|uniref:Major facilitator superfamily (MFS) profile domain-containing protein n=1 Tax=Tieghemostelium lacteum TaxID=361077 RepID=A0A151ZHI5_TIELA|nr:hypothetical protein DLAC_06052 [Tieghemostelium lacteum]|eukprot:KYQ93375.1 hypothetical protein DLAC_06052 [Tieghemostelium lacteum]
MSFEQLKSDEHLESDIPQTSSNNNIIITSDSTASQSKDSKQNDTEKADLLSGVITSNRHNEVLVIEEGEDGEEEPMLGDTSLMDGDDSPNQQDSGQMSPVIKDEESNILVDDDDKPPPIPTQQWIRIIIIFYAVLSDGLSLTLVQPFLPAILEEKWGFEPAEIGTISGILVGCYSLARFFSGFYLGHLSDKYGRKPFLVLSLFSTGMGTLIFAFMPNVYLAMLVRLVEGLLSNSTALCQTTLSDIVHKRNRSTIFAYLGGTFALSRCLSSSLGGFMVKFFEDKPNPYIYPCIVGGIIVLTSCGLILFLHPETHPKYTKLEYIQKRDAGTSIAEHDDSSSSNSTSDVLEEEIDSDAVELTEKSSDKDKSSSASTPTKNGSSSSKELTFTQGMRVIIQDRGLVLLLIIGGVNSFNNGGLLLGIVLFCSTAITDRGLGFGPPQTGVVFTILGFAGFFFQILFFKRLSASIGLKRQYILGMALLCVGIALFPLTFTGYLIQGEALVWVWIGIIIPVISIGFMQGLPIVQGMVANASNPQIQGLTQGTAQSLSSFLRAFGPAVSGGIFTASIKNNITWLLFIVLSVLYVFIAIASLWIPESVDINRQAQKLKKSKVSK